MIAAPLMADFLFYTFVVWGAAVLATICSVLVDLSAKEKVSLISFEEVLDQQGFRLHPAHGARLVTLVAKA